MHELGVVYHIMDTLEEVAKENSLSKIHAVTVEIGEVSTVLPDYLIDCWAWAVKKRPLLSDCRMEVERLPAFSFCEECSTEYPTVAHGRICPNCGSEKTYLLRGNELNIKEVEVE